MSIYDTRNNYIAYDEEAIRFNTSNKEDLKNLKRFIKENDWNFSFFKQRFFYSETVSKMTIQFIYEHDKYCYGVEARIKSCLMEKKSSIAWSPIYDEFFICNNNNEFDADFFYNNKEFNLIDKDKLMEITNEKFIDVLTIARNPDYFGDDFLKNYNIMESLESAYNNHPHP